MKRITSWLKTTIVIAASMAMTACGNKQAQTEEVQYVKTVEAKRIGDDAELNYPGRTKSSEEVNVAFRVSGTILRVLVDEGQFVKKGNLSLRWILGTTKFSWLQPRPNTNRLRPMPRG